MSSNDSETSDEPMDSAGDESTFKENLRTCLDDVQHDGTFSSFRHFSTYVNPGLHINNYGAVGLPLTTRDAEAISRICKQAPFGKGAETIVDTSVRKTWELDQTEFDCQNPAWATFLEQLAKWTMDDLGVRYQTRAARYKLLLYEEGAFFKAHKDSEKAPGMFGTLVICLPSEHSGGEVYLVHGKEKRILETATKSKFDLSTLAWYSDVQHEIRAVTSGYRLVLTYNLLQLQGTPQTAAALDASHARLERLLCTWRTNFAHLNMLLYPLEHQYTEASLCLKNLKGHDAARGRYLQSLCAKNGVYWFLGRLTRTTEDDYDDGAEETELTLDHVVTPDGRSIGLDFSDVDHSDIVVDDFYADRSPDSEEEGEFTGNEGATTTYSYYDTVLVLLRKEGLFNGWSKYGCQDASSLQALFDLVLEDLRHSDVKAIGNHKHALKTIMGGVISGISTRNSSWSYGSSTEEYHRLFTRISEVCSTMGHASVTRLALQEAMQDPKWTSSTGPVRLVAKQASVDWGKGDVDAWSKWFAPKIHPPTFKVVNESMQGLKSIKAELPTSTSQSFNDWMHAHVPKMLSLVKDYSKDDIPALRALIPSVAPEHYFDFMLPTLTNQAARDTLSLLLYRLISDMAIPRYIVRKTLEIAIQNNAPTLGLSVDDFEHKKPSAYGYHPCHSQGSFDDSIALPTRITTIFDKVLGFSLDVEASRLVAVAFSDFPAAESPFWTNWERVLEFVDKLKLSLQRHQRDSVNASALPFVTTTLNKIAESFRRRRPVEPKDWTRTVQKSCPCGPCQSMERFLADPGQPTFRFSKNEQTRRHLQDRLPSADYRFETDKSRSPHTLVITKTNNEYHRLSIEWRRDAVRVRAKLHELRSQFSQSQLGDGYTKLLSLENLLQIEDNGVQRPSIHLPNPTQNPRLLAGSAPASFPSTTSSYGDMGAQNRHPPSWFAAPKMSIPSLLRDTRDPPMVAGTKRKAADVVDLTEGASD